jgi:hypothetical protein
MTLALAPETTAVPKLTVVGVVSSPVPSLLTRCIRTRYEVQTLVLSRDSAYTVCQSLLDSSRDILIEFGALIWLVQYGTCYQGLPSDSFLNR